MYILQFDGLFRGVPGGAKTTEAGFMGYGWLIYKDGVVIGRGHGLVGRRRNATSNVAEYLALIEGLEALLDLGLAGQPVQIMGDAKCVLDQMRGASAVSSERIRPVYQRAARLAAKLGEIEWVWKPRRQNREADQLTRRALRQIRIVPGQYDAALEALDPRNQAHASNKFLQFVDLRVFQPALVCA